MPTGPFSFAVTPSPVIFTEPIGATATQTITLSQTVASTFATSITYSTSSCGNWLSGSSSANAPGTFTVTANASGLMAGTCNGSINITSPLTDAAPQNITVTLTVSPAATPPGPGINTAVGSSVRFAYPSSGQAINAELGQITQTLVDAAGNVYTADAGNQMVFKISPSGALTVIAGNNTSGSSGDGGPAIAAQLSMTTAGSGLALDSAGNLYIADSNNNKIRKIDTSGIITTVVGTGTAGFSGDGGTATSATLNSPRSLAVDSLSNVYVADINNHRIRKISPGGTITTVAGTGSTTFSGDGGLATAAGLNSPQGVAVDSANNLYISDTSHNRIRRVDAVTGIITTIAGNGTAGFSGDGAAATAATMNSPGTWRSMPAETSISPI
jgi:sugar lactone lactonase YvrE